MKNGKQKQPGLAQQSQLQQSFYTSNSADRAIFSKCMQALLTADAFSPQTPEFFAQISSLSRDLELRSEVLKLVSKYSWLPIEAFKYQPQNCFAGSLQRAVSYFRSSGTTSQDRSQVFFSEAGLQLYETQAWQAFLAVLTCYFREPEQVKAFRLIPSCSDWPNSSLAHMLDSFAKRLDLSYDPEGCQIMEQKEPIWIFGTAFHFINLYDQGFRCHLPKGSVIFETGGTKGRSREVSREELFENIKTMFGVSKNFIVSEYGMSELACQAYDFVEKPWQAELKLQERYYRFPRWVQVEVLTAKHGRQKQGTGALLVKDPMRIDCPWPIRTQDLSQLQADGRFQLLGRIQSAPLKGCSLRVDELVDTKVELLATPAARVRYILDEKLVRERAQQFYEPIRQALNSDYFQKQLAEYFQSPQIANWALDDLQNAYPENVQALSEAAISSLGEYGTFQHWLIIGPQSHPVALFHPLLIGSVLNLNMKVRTSSKGHKLESYFAKQLVEVGASIQLLAADFRLQGADPASDAIMVFGSNETIQQIKNISGQALQGFGSHLAAIIISASDLAAHHSSILKDAFSLKQRGCRSARLVFIVNDLNLSSADFKTKISSFASSLATIWADLNPDFEEMELLALQHEQIRLDLNHIQYQPNSTELLQQATAIFSIEDFKLERSLDSYLNQTPFVLPLVAIEAYSLDDFLSWLQQFKELQTLTLSPKLADNFAKDLKMHYEVRSIGQANILAWDGSHDQRPLFQASHL